MLVEIFLLTLERLLNPDFSGNSEMSLQFDDLNRVGNIWPVMMPAHNHIALGLIVIVWVGLGPFAGLIALTIHSVAALGKLYSEEIEHIDPGPIEAVTATGANRLQVIAYGIFPQIIPPFLALLATRQ